MPFEKTDSLGCYNFELEMNDSTAFYDLSFYSRIDCTRSQFCQIREFPLEVTMVSPSAVEYGVWKMSVKVPDIKGMRGLGLVVEKKQ